MNISPLNQNTAAALAGAERAAATQSAKSTDGASHGSGRTPGLVEQAEPIGKADLSGDSDADGRQTLDTFERHHREQQDDEADHATGAAAGEALSGSATGDSPSDPVQAHLDLQG